LLRVYRQPIAAGGLCGLVIYPSWNRACNPKDSMGWSVYIIRCDDGSLYTGVSTDVERRFREHRGHPRGARYFNGRKPLEVVWREGGHTRSSACRREAAIKKLSREGKLRLILQDAAMLK